MPYRLELTWIQHCKRWRKRYLGQTYYLKTRTNGKRDRAGYEAALREWERLKAYVDGLGLNPYTHTGALIPENHPLAFAQHAPPAYVYASPPAYAPAWTPPQAMPPQWQAPPTAEPPRFEPPPKPDHPCIIGYGFHPEQAVQEQAQKLQSSERRVRRLAEAWHDARRAMADRGELSLKQWAEDRAKLKTFLDFTLTNYPTLQTVDQITPEVLNLFRDHQWTFVGSSGEHAISKATLKKRLDTVAKWLAWLVDQNVLRELPKDLRTYARVRMDKPVPLFWSVADIRKLAENATPRTKLYIQIALNLGFTQRDIATLEKSMIDWDTGIVTRDRQKTGVPMKSILWPSTLKRLHAYRNRGRGPLLVGQNGRSLYVETVNAKGSLIPIDAIRNAFEHTRKAAGFGSDPRSFKHLRKTAANRIEQVRPDLTAAFLGHAEGSVKKHYVVRHWEELFAETLKLEAYFGFAEKT